MKKKTSILLVTLFSILFIFSCGKEELEDVTLSLSEMSIELAAEATEKNITVNTNQTEWTAMTGADWITLNPSGSTLNIKVEENNNTVSRKTTVTVLAGGVARNITIIQKPTAVSIELLPDAIEVDQWGGERTFDVVANTKDWTVSTDADWIEIREKKHKNEILIVVKENQERTKREAKLVLTGATTVKEITVKQSGIIYYILPCLTKGSTSKEVKDFELSRNSEIVITINSLQFGDLNFDTKSKVFNRISYKIEDNILKGAIVFVTDAAAITDPSFKTFMKENKFELVDSKEEGVDLYELNTPKYTIEAAVYNHGNTTAAIGYTIFPKQDKDYKTFASIPYGFTGFKTAEAEQVMQYENENGGVLLTDSSKTFLYYGVANKRPLVNRAYWFKGEAPHVLEEHLQVFSDLSLAFWEDEGTLYPTKEFEALLAKDDFKFLQMQKGAFIYGNNKYNIAISSKKFSDVEEGRPVLMFSLFVVEEEPTSKKLIEPRDLSKYLK